MLSIFQFDEHISIIPHFLKVFLNNNESLKKVLEEQKKNVYPITSFHNHMLIVMLTIGIILNSTIFYGNTRNVKQTTEFNIMYSSFKELLNFITKMNVYKTTLGK